MSPISTPTANAPSHVLVRLFALLLPLLAASCLSAAFWQCLQTIPAARLHRADASSAHLHQAAADGRIAIRHVSDQLLATVKLGSFPNQQERRHAASALLPWQLALALGLVSNHDPAAASAPPQPAAPTFGSAAQSFVVASLLAAGLVLIGASSMLGTALIPGQFFRSARRHRRRVLRLTSATIALATPTVLLLVGFGMHDRSQLVLHPTPPLPALAWAAALLASLGAIVGWSLRRRIALAASPRLGRCPRCSYPATHTAPAPCPECGLPRNSRALLRRRVAARRAHLLALWSLLLAAVTFATPVSVLIHPETSVLEPGSGEYLRRWLTLRLTNDSDFITRRGFILWVRPIPPAPP